jgi:hypothetical protein
MLGIPPVAPPLAGVPHVRCVTARRRAPTLQAIPQQLQFRSHEAGKFSPGFMASESIGLRFGFFR